MVKHSNLLVISHLNSRPTLNNQPTHSSQPTLSHLPMVSSLPMGSNLLILKVLQLQRGSASSSVLKACSFV